MSLHFATFSAQSLETDGFTIRQPALRHERGMMKAALLYADRVTVLSPSIAFLGAIFDFANTGREDSREELEGMLQAYRSHRARQTTADLPDDLARRLDDPRDKLRGWLAVLDQVSQSPGAWEGMWAWRDGMAELRRAVDTGLVEVDWLGMPVRHLPRDAQGVPSDAPLAELAQAAAVRSILGDLATSGGRIPVLDAPAAQILKGVVDLAHEELSARSLVEAALSDRIIRSVEAFPDAELDVLLDVRERLERSLVRFRGAILQLTNEVKTLPWSRDFDAEVDALYRRRVQPALVEVADELDELHARPTLLRVGSSIATTAAVGTTIGLAVATVGSGFAGFPEALAGAPIAALAAAVASELRERAKLARQASCGDFYFLAELRRSLS